MTPAGGKDGARKTPARVAVKICGLTRVAEAEACVRLGADAIGCVFFPKSARHVSEERAAAICRAVDGGATTVGVFVNETFDTIMGKVVRCGLAGVQLHGQEAPDLVQRLAEEGVPVIKALFDGGRPSLEEAGSYRSAALMVECAKGPLPGGNAVTWDWASARPLGAARPMILAGGLSPRNVAGAIAAARPSAVDVSSGVEASPGRKDLQAVARFLSAVGKCPKTALFEIFGPRKLNP
jgi:phosphoribosylanthranilate isomerase